MPKPLSPVWVAVIKRKLTMPHYDYRCKECTTVFEAFQSMNDPKLKKCLDSACGGELERLIGSGGGIIFKGPGFYATDYKSPSYKRDRAAQK